MNRGEVILAVIPNVGGPGGKKRPALVVQSDLNNARLRETIIAAITSNISRVYEDHQLLIDISTADGAATGLLRIRPCAANDCIAFRRSTRKE